MQNQNWRFLNRVIVIATVILLVASFTTFAAAQSEDVRAAFAAAPKERTNVEGVRVFAGPPAGFNPLIATGHDLAMYGLPQRPDKAAEPKAYRLWERAMLTAKHRAPAKLDVKSFSSTAMKAAQPELAAISGAQKTGLSYNWSGVASTNALKKWNAKTSFIEVLSIFNVPTVQPPFGGCGAITGPFYEVSWNGIDGFNNGDVVQGGSLSAVDCYGHTEYEAWVEWYPSYPILGAFLVNPGDDMYVMTLGAPGTSNQYVFIDDETNGSYGTYELTWVSGPGLVGSSAEYIVERPCCASNGYPLALANYLYDFYNNDLSYNGAAKAFYPGSATATTYNIGMVADDGVTVISTVEDGTGGEQGLESLWFSDTNCALIGGCTP